MSYLLPAQAAAQVASLLVFTLIARWYAVPLLVVRGRAAALTPLLWIHVFRYVALQAFVAQRDGCPISDGGVMAIVLGDVSGAALALAAIVALRLRLRLGIALSWVLVMETAYDTVENISNGSREHLLGQASGVNWLILAFYVPLILVSLALILWQLYARRGESLAADRVPARSSSAIAPAR